MDHYEAIWVKKDETNEEPGSMVQIHPPTATIKEELKEGEDEEYVEDPLGISCSPDFISEEPEVILEVDETQNIVITSTSYETDRTRLIKNGESCGVSFEEPNNQEVAHENLEIGTKGSARASEEDSVFRMRLKCCLEEKEFHKFGCSCCSQSFPSKYRLIMHVFIHIDNVQPPAFVCKSCGEVFPSSVSLNKHLKMSEGDRGLSAGIKEETGCSDDHKNILEGEDSVSEETGKQSSCKKTWKISKKSFNDSYNTLTMAHDAGKRDRRENNETLSRKGNVDDRAVKVTAKRLHRCDVCGKSFTRIYHLKSHALGHTGLKPYKCDICGKSFARPGSVNRHYSIHSGKKPDRSHKCDICGKCFSELRYLKNHVLVHTGISPYKCDICGKCFTASVSLKRHTLIHTGIRSHKCDICGKSFTLLGDLNRHSLTHIDYRPHKCDVCGKYFSRLDDLRRHTLYHTGTSPFKCVTCGKSFTQLYLLRRHSLAHTGLRPHKCDTCGKSYTERRALKKHALTHRFV